MIVVKDHGEVVKDEELWVHHAHNIEGSRG